MDILSRLPVRSLLRFKCVSSFWKTLISEPYLKTKHLTHAKTNKNSQKRIIKIPKNFLLANGTFLRMSFPCIVLLYRRFN